MSSDKAYPRDLVGYGQRPPPAQWPAGARIAVQFVVNYEEGPTIHAMAKGSSFVENEIKIPAIMISKSYGELITKFLDAPQHSVDLENVNIEMQNVGQCDYSSILKGKLYIKWAPL